MNILEPIFKVFGQFLMLMYNFTGSYVLALVLFTLAIKVVLFPLSIKGKKSMMQTQSLQGKMQQLQKQYGKDKQRYNEEVQKLYEKEHVSPMGGCLWSLLPLPILWGVYAVVRRPLFYMYNLTADQVTAVQDAVENITGVFSGNTAYLEMKVAGALNTSPTAFSAAQAALGDAADKITNTINFQFFGVNLADVPNLKFWEGGITWNSVGLLLIPILVAVVSIFSSIVTQKTNAINQGNQSKAMDATSKQMLIMMPLMYLWFGFIMPAAMCLYMMANALLTMLQELLAGRMLRKQFAEMREKRERQEALEKEEEKRKKLERIEQNRIAAEEAKKKKKKAALQPGEKKTTNNNGRVGIRQYARGRSYDPNRYGEVTEYKDPTAIIDETAVEAALAKKGKKPTVAEEAPEQESAPVSLKKSTEEAPEETASTEG